jgi:hypothetical protein
MTNHWKEEPWQDEAKLRDAYYRLGTQQAVADEFGCSKPTVIKWMEKFDIESFHGDPNRDLYDKELLTNLYEETLSVPEVVNQLPETDSREAVRNWLDNFGVEITRSRGKTETYSCENCEREYERYSSLEKDQHFCSKSCHNEWMSDHLIGEESPAWKGGYNPNYSHGWTSARDEVRERDSVCQKCGADPERALDVHHIQPVRTFDDCSDAHTLDNLVGLCRSCHRTLEPLPEDEQREIIDD